MKKHAPLVIFVYNRLHLTKLMLETINKNFGANETEVFIYSDGPKNEYETKKVEEVRRYICDFANDNNFKKTHIIISDINKGLANSIISGVSEVIKKYDRVIVLEDDLITSPHFLNFMNDGLEFYENNYKIWSIGGTTYDLPSLKTYKHDVYACYRGESCGWATWLDRWEKVDWEVKDFPEFMKDGKRKRRFNRGGPDMVDMLKRQMNGKMDSWAIRWCYQQSKLDMLTILPGKTLIENIGWDGSGTHCGIENRFVTKIDGEFTYCLEEVDVNENLMKEYRAYFSRPLLNKMLDYVYLKMREIDIFQDLIERVSVSNKQKREKKNQ